MSSSSSFLPVLFSIVLNIVLFACLLLHCSAYRPPFCLFTSPFFCISSSFLPVLSYSVLHIVLFSAFSLPHFLHFVLFPPVLLSLFCISSPFCVFASSLFCISSSFQPLHVSIDLHIVLLSACWSLHHSPEAVDMNGRFQMQGGKNWFLPKEMNANRATLIGWKSGQTTFIPLWDRPME